MKMDIDMLIDDDSTEGMEYTPPIVEGGEPLIKMKRQAYEVTLRGGFVES